MINNPVGYKNVVMNSVIGYLTCRMAVTGSRGNMAERDKYKHYPPEWF